MAGKYTVYDKYKETGIEWMGKVPEHWGVKSLKSILAERKEKNDPIKTKNILSLTMDKGVIPYSERDGGGNKAKEDISAYKLAYPNDIVLNSMNVVVGSVGLSKYFGAVSPVYYMLYPRKEEDKVEYFSQIFQSETFQRSLLGLGNGILMKESESSNKLNTIRMRIPMDKLNIQALPYPNAKEQQQIANFLDHETAKIDTLIEKQQQLIKLLKEKRQAVISHAVTKGLNPNAKMRDSGVEWLGEVPEHWVVAQLKFNTLEMQTGPFGSQLHAEDYVDGGIPLVNPAHMTEGKIVPDSKVSVDHETWNRLSRHQLFEGDLIFARRGELGRCAVITKGEEGWLCGTGSLKAKLNEKLIPEYSYLLITSDGVVSELSLESKGSTMDNLNTETLGRVRLPVPPTVEQKKILSYVKEVSGKYDCLIDKASSAIGLMQERRTALISAAVTGKIDVRNWQAPNG